MTLYVARAKFGESLAVCDNPSPIPLYTTGPHSGELGIDVLHLSAPTPIEPEQGLRELGIAPVDKSALRRIEPEEVLALLKALPVAAQDAWTKRVVARGNDIPEFAAAARLWEKQTRHRPWRVKSSS